MKQYTLAQIIPALKTDKLTIGGRAALNIMREILIAGKLEDSGLTLESKWTNYQRNSDPRWQPPPTMIGDDESNPDWKKRGHSDVVCYEDCITSTLTIGGDLVISIYEGDYSGFRSDSRCCFVIRGKWARLLELFGGAFLATAWNNFLYEVGEMRKGELQDVEDAALARIAENLINKGKSCL